MVKWLIVFAWVFLQLGLFLYVLYAISTQHAMPDWLIPLGILTGLPVFWFRKKLIGWLSN